MLVFLSLLACYSSCFSQQVDGVTLYESKGYDGRFEVVRSTMIPGASGPGRMLHEFKNKVSSVKVPPGMVAILYEYARGSAPAKSGTSQVRSSGYGRYVELMEDCPDLSVYGLEDSVSYVTVFPATRPGFHYVRTKIENGDVIPGHWEKANENGRLPDNSPPGIVQIRIELGSE